ncbi:uncharacterized protein [Apostichopus japonicus]|uniref:uncharacterized protein n=1 Tax=Stichopus japonicus TaxID=307972 RepID=UPI003AB29DF0
MNSAAVGNASWDNFVQDHLLQHGIIDGVCLISKLGQILYQYGVLVELTESKVSQFLLHFANSKDEDADQLMQRGFCVTLKGAPVALHINKKTKSSVYAVAGGSQMALLVGNLPHGVLLCTHVPTNKTAGQAIKQFEQVCSLLRT